MEDNEIIPYQEIIGNYNFYNPHTIHIYIIPYQEIIGNYNSPDVLEVFG